MGHQSYYYAHSRPNHSEGEWEPLDAHLSQVAALAGEFTGSFSAGAYGARRHDVVSPQRNDKDNLALREAGNQ